MFIYLIKNDSINSFTLPNKVYGIYWISDVLSNGIEKELISISAEDDKWILTSNTDVYIVENKVSVNSKEIKPYTFYAIYNKFNKEMNFIYATPLYDNSFARYKINKKCNSLLIGKSEKCDIVIKNDSVSDVVAEFQIGEKFIVHDNGTRSGIYLNKKRIKEDVQISSGDSLFVSGVRIIVVVFDSEYMLMINNPLDSVKINSKNMEKLLEEPNDHIYDTTTDNDAIVYSDDSYFNKKPRFKESITPLNVVIDAPPAKQQKSDMPAILVYGPMFTSAAMSVIYAYMTIRNLVTASWEAAWPSLTVCVLSLMATLFWPLIIGKYTKFKMKKEEKIRSEKYNMYLKNILDNINQNAATQTQVMLSNSPDIDECKSAIETRNQNFWNRRVEDSDFLNVNLGKGEVTMQIDIKVPEMHFSLVDDDLLEKASKFGNEMPILKDVPITYNFRDVKITATIGDYSINKFFTDNIIFQMSALHSYDDLKIVLLTSEYRDKSKGWDYLKVLPHCWDDEKTIRFFASTKDEIREICYYLDNKLTQRLEDKSQKSNARLPFYLIITDDYKSIRNFDFIKRFSDLDSNMGFSLLIINDRIYDLPAQCDTFINVNKNQSEIFKNILNAEVKKFQIDFEKKIDLYYYSKLMANVPILINNSNGSLVDKIGFLELYEVGKIEQLNILNRWRDSNPMLSLQALVGLGQGGEKINIDLHEKFHGPHGLIAGMTGSGKSEFIATYILSLAINYHPYEVQFVLIDYKGGGLTGIFENSITGVKLPHLVGTITNLDENEIARCLASFEAELKRRQRIFGEVREKLGDSVIDIYKYQQLYRDGVLSVPMSHLFIISDEFAELKAQQPEFLQQLISISRIGRSLGIHLILATQKPSGVVDNQIWSNSRFRVCLRVQEKADSNEVIKCPDAAFLKNAGRFYFQVGYNEVFVLGQAAWGGKKYVPVEKIKTKAENSIEFVDNIGYSLKKVDIDKANADDKNYGEEIKNIVQYLNQIAIQEDIKTTNLWLDKIPEYINIDDLKKKYDYMKEDFFLDIPIGEYDVPYRQKQYLLTVPFSKEGNVLVYGSTGSGKENFITTLLYSAVTDYIPDELICYIIDCGTQSLNVFNDIPHIGDIIPSDNSEKVTNLYKFLFYMLNERKNLFEKYNGDYDVYCKTSGSTVPSVLVIINNYDSYIELFSNFDENLIQLTREGPKFGIYFVITVSNQSLIKNKLQQNFKLSYVLQQTNVADYSNILGNVNKKYPSKIFGRGIVRMGDIFEFQTAMISEQSMITAQIEKIKPVLIRTSRLSAIKIPVLPKTVTRSDIDTRITMDGSFVVGIEKQSLNIMKYDLKNSFVNLFLSYDLSFMTNFLNPFFNQIVFSNYYDLSVINSEGIECSGNGYNVYTENFEGIALDLINFIADRQQIYVENNYNKAVFEGQKPLLYVIIGIDGFIGKLNMDVKNDFTKALEVGKDLGIITFCIVDTVDKVKKYEFESWYKNVVNNSRGLFFGNGLLDQMSIKITKNDRELRADIPFNFCYIVNHGRPELVKYVEEFDINQ